MEVEKLNDVKFDKVRSLKRIPREEYKHKYVYDFSVEGNETFSLTNGLMVHNTLNTFHLAGVSSKSNVNQGVPRLRELISITKNIKTPSLTLYLNPSINSNNKALDVLGDIQKITFDYFVKSTEIYFDPNVYNKTSIIDEDKDFVRDYYNFHEMFEDTKLEKLSPWVLRIKIHPLFLLNKKMRLLYLNDKIAEHLGREFTREKFNIIYSNENAENIVFHIRLRYDNINKKSGDEFITNDDVKKLRDVETFLMSNLIIRGNNNIKDAYVRELKEKYVKKGDGSIQTKSSFVIDTMGTDLKNVVQMCDFINKNRIYSNDLHEMLSVYGIEVAREVLKNEINNIIKHNGIYINKRHLDLLVDLMTHKGFLNSIDRHGMNKADAGPLTKMSFEEAESQLSHASIGNQKDKMNSITSNLIMGQVGKYGTGYPEVLFDDTVFG